MAIIITLIALVLAAAGLSFQPSDALPQVVYPGAYALQDDTYIYLRANPAYGACNAQNRAACAFYAYIAFEMYDPAPEDGYAVDHFTGRAVTISQVWAVTYYGEFGLRNEYDAEALARGFFNRRAGACPWNGILYDCSFDNLITWLSTMGHWINSVVMTTDDKYAVVNWRRLTGDRDNRETGWRYYTDWLDGMIMAHIETWRTGQGYNVPSVWGNYCLLLGQRLEGTIYHQRDVGACGDGGRLVFLVVGTGNRHAVWSG